MKQTPEKPPEPIVFNTGALIDGRYYPPGADTPYTSETEVPPNLKPCIARGDEPAPWHPSERNIYQHLRPESHREARQVLGNCLYQEDVEDFVARANQLPPETEAILAEKHAEHVAAVKMQMLANQYFVEAAEARAQAEAEVQVARLFVRRGTGYVDAATAQVKPAENVFSKQPTGEFWVVGTVDAYGELPPEEITP